MEKIFLNGEFVSLSEVKVLYNDRGYVFGDGIYEYIWVYNGKLFIVIEYYERFLCSVNEIGLDLNYFVEELIELFCKLVDMN